MSAATAGRKATAALPKADRWRSAPAAGLAALAESGMIFLPLMQLSSESVAARGGPLMSYAVVVPLLVAGTAVGTGVRRVRPYSLAAGAAALTLGLLQGIAFGDSDIAGTAFLSVLSLLAALRAVTLALRDWQNPVKGSFAGGATLLIVEIVVAGSAGPRWHQLLPVVIAQFFVGSLASRAASTMFVERAWRGTGPAHPRKLVAPGLALAGLGAGLALAASLGRPDGVLRAAGRLAYPAVVAVLVAVAYVTAKVLLGPLTWLMARLHVSLAPLRTLARSLQRISLTTNARPQRPFGPAWVERILGLLVLVAVAALVVWALNRKWPRLRRAPSSPEEPAEATPLPLPAPRPFRPRAPRLHRELPADTVRRWYAEALVQLQRRGVAKPPHLTPAEFLVDVVAAFPGSAEPFSSLTRAYEDVRYGKLRVARASMVRLDRDREAAMEAFRRAARADAPPPEDGGGM